VEWTPGLPAHLFFTAGAVSCTAFRASPATGHICGQTAILPCLRRYRCHEGETERSRFEMGSGSQNVPSPASTIPSCQTSVAEAPPTKRAGGPSPRGLPGLLPPLDALPCWRGTLSSEFLLAAAGPSCLLQELALAEGYQSPGPLPHRPQAGADGLGTTPKWAVLLQTRASGTWTN
jgi:hypothetical protein